jgi:hypothetical protein
LDIFNQAKTKFRRKAMRKKLTILSTAIAAFLAAGSLPALAETLRVQVVGVTSDRSQGNRNPARRHEDCANEFVNGRWCSTQDYLAGGMAIPANERLNTAWIRPTIASVASTPNFGLVYVDVSGAVATPFTLNCNQWSSREDGFRGTVLQRQEDDNRQLVSTRQCSDDLRTLCCAPVGDDF